MCFGGDIRARQLERSIGGLQGQGYCVESYITVQYHSALLAHARPTMFYISLVGSAAS